MGTALRVLLITDSEDDTLLLERELPRGGYESACERVGSAAALIGIVQQQGGYVASESALGRGTAMRVSSPAAGNDQVEACGAA